MSKTKNLALADMTKAELIQVIQEQGRPVPTPRLLASIRRNRLIDEARKEARCALTDMQATRDRTQWLAANQRCTKAQNKWDALMREQFEDEK